MRLIILLITVSFLSACSYIKPLEGPPTVPQVLSEAQPLPDLTRSRIPEPNAPYVPILREPDVMRFWVLPRTNDYDDQLQGYWWHILATDWAFEARQGSSVSRSTRQRGPYSALETEPSESGESELGFTSNADAIRKQEKEKNRLQRGQSGSPGLTTAAKNQILKAIQKVQSGAPGANGGLNVD